MAESNSERYPMSFFGFQIYMNIHTHTHTHTNTYTQRYYRHKSNKTGKNNKTNTAVSKTESF